MPASTGDISRLISFPYRQRPASILKEFLAPNPASLTSLFFNISLTKVSEYPSFIDNSYPSSPV